MRLKDFTWLNPPALHSFEGNAVHVVTGAETDFWRETFYDFRRDSGHFLRTPITGDFTAEVTVDGRYEALYDQAGLMIRLSESNWIKAGVEYTDGEPYFSTVVTNDTSDWSLTGIKGRRRGRTNPGDEDRRGDPRSISGHHSPAMEAGASRLFSARGLG